MSAKKSSNGRLPIKIGASAKLEIRKSIKETVPEVGFAFAKRILGLREPE